MGTFYSLLTWKMFGIKKEKNDVTTIFITFILDMLRKCKYNFHSEFLNKMFEKKRKGQKKIDVIIILTILILDML